MDKTKLITNSLIELGVQEDEGKGKGRYFQSKFIEAGIAHYDELGDILITKETLDKFIQTMVGCPVIIDHEDVNDKNVDKLRVGVISKVWYNEYDGWFWCEGVLTDNEAIDLIKNQGWSVSCAYSFVSDNQKKTYHGKEIDMEFVDGEFLHLAIVKNPRYEGAGIVVNKKDDDLEWITVKGNHIPVKKGQSKGEAIEEFLKQKKDNQKYFHKQNENRLKEILYTELPDAEKELKDTKKEIRQLKENGKMTQEKRIELNKKENKLELKIDSLKKELEDLKQKKDKYIQEEQPKYSTTEEHREKLSEVDIDWKNWLKEHATKKQKEKQLATNNTEKENVIMQVLNELKEFIKSVVSNEKEDEMAVKNEDKRELIDEIGGILKDKVDEEVWRTIVGKLEKIAYKPSEDDKADNEEEKDEKEAKNKCKNEEDKKEEKTENEDEEKEDKKEEKVTENEEDKEKEDKKEVKNSMTDILMGGKGQVEEKKLYTSRKERLEEGNKY